MIVTIDIGEVLRTLFLIVISLGLCIVAFELIVGYFYDHYCGDKSTKEYKDSIDKTPK